MFALSSSESVGMFAYLVSFLLFGTALAKVFTACELAEVLRATGKIPEEQISTWVCIARYESEYNSTAVGSQNGDGSNDHGIFQISDKYWCFPEGYACNIPCEQLTDDDLTDDIKCARRIYRQHQRLQGNGFKAWAVYQAQCSDMPTIVSFPHFYHADKIYQNAIDGLKPNRKMHETFIDIEPTTGVPLRGYKRVQLNIRTKRTSAVRMLTNQTDAIFPILWFEEKAELGDKEVSMLRDQLLKVLKIADIIKWLFIGFGIVLALLGIAMTVIRAKEERKNRD